MRAGYKAKVHTNKPNIHNKGNSAGSGTVAPGSGTVAVRILAPACWAMLLLMISLACYAVVDVLIDLLAQSSTLCRLDRRACRHALDYST